MALTKCLECGQEISDRAFTCPKCGNPLQDINKITQQSPVTIEQTNKGWKAVRLISWVMIIGGIILFLTSLQVVDPSKKSVLGIVGIFFGIIGIVGNLIGKFGSWWDNR